ncbi:hypothetical protein PPYR_11775 [Photinus pyralis]|uniref:PX domain-containing protein n=1 Tax=Photinus pyralis TaxID=7054 RepID=A0A1Y1M3M0_PHOPY|nr:sorting nexin-7-like [Photinus pyralis]KAB0794936.1 hypothetical protein PPYR_11775 [Photinus pyralis]
MEDKDNSSAVLDVLIENKAVPSLLKDAMESDRASLCSNSTIDNSLVQSPSLESFSTIPDTEALSELNIDENSDLYIKVDNPQKHLDTLETYITFRITTRVARIEFTENEYVVRRRYNEFAWLRQRLLDCHPFCIVPPLPAKHTLIGQLDRYAKDFILVRMKLLNTFITRVAQHPILSCNEHLKIFLTASQGDFNLHRKQRSNINNKILMGNTSNMLSTRASIKNRHIEFEKARDYLTTLSEKLVSIEKIASRINKESHEYVSELQSYYPIFSNWSMSEPELSPILQNIANAFEKCTFAQSALIYSYTNTVANPIKEFLMYIDVIKDTLHKRDLYQHIYNTSLDDLDKKRTEKDQLLTAQNGSHSSGFSLWKQPSVDDKLEKLGVHIPHLVKKVETNQDNLECANESLRSDLERWQQDKQSCLKKILLDFVNKQIECYEKSVGAWEHVTAELNSQNVTLRSTKK